MIEHTRKPIAMRGTLTFHPTLVIQFLVLLGVANGTPVVVKKFLGERMSWPIDFGRRFFDGQPILGHSKTIRGVVSSIIMTAVAARFMGFYWSFGVFVSVISMAGDLMSSFVKRRLRMEPSSMALGLDQIPESLLPAIVCASATGMTILDILVVTSVFLVGELLLSRLLYALKLRDRPY